MPLGSGKLGFFKNRQLGVGGGTIPINTSMSLNLTYSGNTGISVEANALNIAIDSNFANSIVSYAITGNIASSDFADATLTGNLTLDANGNASISKTIVSTTGAGHKDFIFSVIRPGSSVVLANTDSQYIYEVIGDNISGGDTTTTAVIEAGSHKIHQFTTVGNANLTITSFGNESGNTNVWNRYFRTDSSNSYFDASAMGISFRGTVIGAGGQRDSLGGPAGAGAGELGILKYPRANIYTIESFSGVGTHVVTVGGSTTSQSGAPTNPEANSTIFTNYGSSTTVRRIALAGGGATNIGGKGGSGRGKASERLATANTDLATTGGTWANNFSQFVAFASGSSGNGYGPGTYGSRMGGGGAFGISGAFVGVTSNTNAYGANVSTGNQTYASSGSAEFAPETGGHGARFAANSSVNSNDPAQQFPYFGNAKDYVSFKYNPIYDGANTFVCCGGGRSSGTGSGSNQNPSIGEYSFGGGGRSSANISYTQDGFVSFSYPHGNVRFITGSVVT
jgi:hypothetical protein